MFCGLYPDTDESRFFYLFHGKSSWLTPKAIANDTVAEDTSSKNAVTVSSVISAAGTVEYVYFIADRLEASVRKSLANTTIWKSNSNETKMRSFPSFDYYYNKTGWSRQGSANWRKLLIRSGILILKKY